VLPVDAAEPTLVRSGIVGQEMPSQENEYAAIFRDSYEAAGIA